VATFTFDAATVSVLTANAAGWRALGFDPTIIRPPQALDAAMPAAQSLRALARILATDASTEAALVLWGDGGAITRPCQVRASRTQRATLEVQVPASTTAAEAAMAPGRGQLRGIDAMGDVALRARLGHELRTPLSAVVAYAEILKDEHFGPMASRRYQGYARNIYESARHALGVVDSMLKSDPAPSGIPQLTFTDIDPGSIVESCLMVARPLADKAGLVLSAEIPARLPRVVADEVSLKQMLLNLLANAIKFARHGDQVKVLVAYDCNGPLTIAVADTGPGMSPPVVAISAPPTPGLAASNAGLGLGLPLTKTLAEANGAILAIESAHGKGTCATISFGKDRVVLQ
jgi:signal transduction histidine kinase